MMNFEKVYLPMFLFDLFTLENGSIGSQLQINLHFLISVEASKNFVEKANKQAGNLIREESLLCCVLFLCLFLSFFFFFWQESEVIHRSPDFKAI